MHFSKRSHFCAPVAGRTGVLGRPRLLPPQRPLKLGELAAAYLLDFSLPATGIDELLKYASLSA